jgi:hypothetical protein
MPLLFNHVAVQSQLTMLREVFTAGPCQITRAQGCFHPLPGGSIKSTSFWYRQASGDGRLLNPVALVENHPACRRNERGHAVLPNQLAWKPHLILLLLSSKLLSETDALLKIQQDSSAGDAQRRAMRMLLAGRKMPPIPYLIASFIQKKSVSVTSALQPVWCLLELWVGVVAGVCKGN